MIFLTCQVYFRPYFDVPSLRSSKLNIANSESVHDTFCVQRSIAKLVIRTEACYEQPAARRHKGLETDGENVTSLHTECVDPGGRLSTC